MRVRRVAPWIYPHMKGSGDYDVHAMSRDQAAMGHDVTVLTTREDEVTMSRFDEGRLIESNKLFSLCTSIYA
ncbi:hypothetical protein DJ79_02505 [Halorubrum ezzemoulense]|uniref:Glycosyltransferase subfamily 4-like N-terminal domain-containing protein n=1 Tax=Halorubrum ezzemoulense TaxID=337243 RepID=A0A256JMV0_HALEZ|nr:hypothetical protein DJ79_02505 [Halorubrum ezzemoulense]